MYAIDVDEADEVCFYYCCPHIFRKKLNYINSLLTDKSVKHYFFLVTQLDDALSATRLPDGRIKVWIHVADPTCFLQPRSILDRLFFLLNKNDMLSGSSFSVNSILYYCLKK